MYSIQAFATVKIRHWGHHIECLTKKQINNVEGGVEPVLRGSGEEVPGGTLSIAAHTGESVTPLLVGIPEFN